LNKLDLAVIGNCQVAALLEPKGRIVWFCVPRFDGDPIFSALLSGDDNPDSSFFDITIEDFSHGEQRYLHNTAIVETMLHDTRGGTVCIHDFAPRFYHYGRHFRPVMLVRRVEPISGKPRIRIRLRATCNYGGKACERTFGSNHIRYVGPEHIMRLTTNASLSHIMEENPFVLEDTVTLMFGPDESVSDSIDKVGLRFFDETKRYWQGWVQSLSIPFEWQEAVIRAATALKLCTFEDTGSVVAALTTSIPEAANSGRNWDYRFCWLRDATYTIQALNRVGATRTMEEFLRYIIDIAATADGEDLQPVYGISGRSNLAERIIEHLPGYRGMGPVRVGNQAYVQRQNDVYGAVVLAATQAFFDTRLSQVGDRYLFERMEQIGKVAALRYDEPDAGLWEYRGRESVHTYSTLMCWAACDRLARIAVTLNLTDRARFWKKHANAIRRVIETKGWDPEQKAFTASFGEAQMDASLLQMHELGFLAADDPRYQSTVAAIERKLRRGNHLFRYASADDFGEPENAFNICTFWYIEALCNLGREQEARELFENMLAHRNPSGLLSEDIDPINGDLWGNIPQTYSMVGIINAATRLSKSWRDAF
jgi:GH15 family glucan-1,4-alpha-glucosidase